MKNFMNFLSGKKNNNTAFSSARSLRMEQLEDRQLLSATTWTSEVSGDNIIFTGTCNEQALTGMNLCLFYDENAISQKTYGTGENAHPDIDVLITISETDPAIQSKPDSLGTDSEEGPSPNVESTQKTDDSVLTNHYLQFTWDLSAESTVTSFKFTDLNTEVAGTQFITVTMKLDKTGENSSLNNNEGESLFKILEYSGENSEDVAEVTVVNNNGTLAIKTPTLVALTAPSVSVGTDITSSSIPLTWGAVENAVSYSVQYKVSTATTWNTYTATPITATNVTVSGLSSGTTYDFQVKAIPAAGSTVYADSAWSAVASGTTSVPSPDLEVNMPMTSLTTIQAVSGAVIADIAINNFTGTPSYTFTINNEAVTDTFIVENGKLKLIKDLEANTYANIVVTATAGSETASSDPFTLTVVTEYVNPEWDLSKLNYKYYKLDATANSASLYGSNALESEETLIGKFNNIGPTSKVSIIGNALKEEYLRITSDASDNLSEIVFQGGNSKIDHVLIDGTIDANEYTISTETATVNTQLFPVNPYLNRLNCFKNFYGEDSQIYQNIARDLNKAYENLRNIFITNRYDFNTVAVTEGATIKAAGVRNIAIEGNAGDDIFNVVNLGTNYDFVGGDGENDKISFASDKINRAVINMDGQYAQCVVPGQIGTVRLHGDIEKVEGSKGNDSIITADNTSSVDGNGGNDVVIVDGDKDTKVAVTLAGRSSVVVRGDGEYTIDVQDGDYSVINAIAASSDSSIKLTAAGRNIVFYGGRGSDIATITGDYVYVDAGAGNDIIRIKGSKATVQAGAGDDFIGIAPDTEKVSQGNIVYGGAGNDVIAADFTTGNNYFYAGLGNDMIIGGEGNDFIYGMSGNNVLIGNAGEDRIFGGSGRDLILANSTAKIRNAEDLEEVYSNLRTKWNLANDPDIDEIVELIGQQSVSDDAKDWLYRGAGFGNAIYYNSKTDKDFASVLTFAPFSDELFDDLTDQEMP